MTAQPIEHIARGRVRREVRVVQGVLHPDATVLVAGSDQEHRLIEITGHAVARLALPAVARVRRAGDVEPFCDSCCTSLAPGIRSATRRCYAETSASGHGRQAGAVGKQPQELARVRLSQHRLGFRWSCRSRRRAVD